MWWQGRWWVAVVCGLAVFGAGTTQAADVLLSGKKLLLRDSQDKPAKRRIVVVVKDASITLGDGPGSADDPTTQASSLRVRSAAAGFDDTYDLSNGQWRVLGRSGAAKGYRVKKVAPVKVVLVKRGKKIKIVAKGAALGHALGDDPGEVDVVLSMGALRHCMTFPAGGKYVSGRKYLAKKAPPAAACPPDVVTTTTTSTTSTTMCVMDPCYDGPLGTVGVGECRAGVRSCTPGMIGVCEGQVLPTAEICNGADDDCDGQTDEDVIPPCT